MKSRSKLMFNIFTLIALLASLLGSAVFVPSVQAVESTLNSSDWAQVKALLPVAAATSVGSKLAYLKASNSGSGDLFGWSIAISGDTIVVGAPWENSIASGVNGNQMDNSANGAGAVYVFTRSGNVWSQQAYLKASNTGIGNDIFGEAVSIYGDTIVVGAPGEDSIATGVNGEESDNTADDAGAAYVFVRNGTTWSQQAYLKASNTQVWNMHGNDSFGEAVSIYGDTIVVGAPEEDSNATGVNGNQADNSTNSSGAAYVFFRSGTTWSQQAYLKASNTEIIQSDGWAGGDEFGRSVTVYDDTIVIGAPYEDSNATGVNGNQMSNLAADSGAAYVFTRSGTNWNQQAYLKASNTGIADRFGFAVSLSGNTLVVGAQGEASGATGVNGDQTNNLHNYAGAAYVFFRDGLTWSQQAYLKASNASFGHLFGSTVSISGNMIAVGSWQENSDGVGLNGNQLEHGAFKSGSAYVFIRDKTTWSQQAYVKSSNSEADDNFGIAVAIDGNTLASGAIGEDSNATGVDGDETNNSLSTHSLSGAAYIYSISTAIPIFADVPISYWANEYVERLASAGITGGCGNGIYCPSDSVTRAQMAVFLLKGIHGSSYTPPAVNSNAGFGDVAVDYWAAAWIKQLAAEGITSGCGSGNYCPDSTVTRAQMAIFLLKAKHGLSYSPPNASGVFSDVPVGYWADKWIEQLAVEGITGGCSIGHYCPDSSVTRAQMAVFLVKTFNLP